MLHPTLRAALLTGTMLAAFSVGAAASTLNIALADDPDALDPVTNRTQVGITVLGTMCAQLVDTDSDLNFQPGLAESWGWSDDGLELTFDLVEGATFHDGTPFDADAAVVNIRRALDQPGSQRRSDLLSVQEVEAVSPTRLVIRVAEPAVELLSKFADRPGMMFSPAALEEHGEDIGANPVCIGPYRFVRRVAQDRIVLERDPDFFAADDFHFDSVVFRIIPDDAVRLANLQAGDVQLIEKVDPSTVSVVEADPSLVARPVNVLNNQTLVINLESDTPMGQDVRVREAFSLSLDREAINQVAFAGQYTPANQPAPPGQYYDPETPMPARDVAAARALLEDTGLPLPVPFTILVPNRPLSVRVAEIMQAMSNEAGFDTRLDVVDFATTLNLTDEGRFTAWGPIGPQFANDPDPLTFQTMHSTGGRNLSRYRSPEMDALLEASRRETDPEARAAIFHRIARLANTDFPIIYLYHLRPIFAHDARLEGLSFTGDGFIRLRGARMAD